MTPKPASGVSERRRLARRRGRWAEWLCRWWLRAKGYAILAQGHVNGRGTGAGEIDIIARRGGLIAFIEVKARATHALAGAALSANQQRRLTRGAAAFLARHPQYANCSIRFDAMLVAPWHWPRHVTDAWRLED
ncbi:YraN family protein [Telmatospirillum sp.]|uniref:YraN family protein n=1 Tax=Telmatospirillum sp. TaxID=2079197 RepID=UPI0028439A7A|nr:YraN family protein [Telmatospirillum sp.]MDR3439642.1 YraN family protein [Telmatospirillum sp.]